MLAPVITGRRPGAGVRAEGGPQPGARPPYQLARSVSLVVGLFLDSLTGLLDGLTCLLDGLTGRRGSVGSGIACGVCCLTGSVDGGITRGRGGITSGIGSLAGRSGSISGRVLRRLDGLLLRAAGNGQGSEGSRKSNLRVHLDVPRI